MIGHLDHPYVLTPLRTVDLPRFLYGGKVKGGFPKVDDFSRKNGLELPAKALIEEQSTCANGPGFGAFSAQFPHNPVLADPLGVNWGNYCWLADENLP